MSTANRPLISVLVTAYNREQYIGEAIESILASTYIDFEVVVVDDCSTDGTVEIVKNYQRLDSRISVYINKKNLGDYPNRNVAASYAKGKYLKYVDSDNYIYPHCLQVMVSCMEQYSEAGLGLCKIHSEDKPLPDSVTTYEAYLEHFCHKPLFTNAPTSAIIRSDCFGALGGFRPIRHRGDLDLWLRLARNYSVVKIPALLDWDRTHPEQEKSKNLLFKRILTYQIYKEALLADNSPLSAVETSFALQDLFRNFIWQDVIKSTLLKEMDICGAARLIRESKSDLGTLLANI
jgi:glycosyltransferase involved in cell wall biosynthesis